MPKLNQIVAVVAGKKSDAEKAITELYHKVKKPQLFEGITKTYEAIEVNGEELPSEVKLLQFKVSEAISQFREAMGPVFDTTLTQDVSNTRTRADVEVDGVAVLKDVPVTYLLFLEKKLTDIQTFITHLPTLDPSQKWSYSRDTDCYVTGETWKYHTKKLPRVLEKAPGDRQAPGPGRGRSRGQERRQVEDDQPVRGHPRPRPARHAGQGEEADRGGQEGPRAGQHDRRREQAVGRRDLRFRLRQAGLSSTGSRQARCLPLTYRWSLARAALNQRLSMPLAYRHHT